MGQYQTLRVATQPAIEPVTLAEAKRHLRVDSNDDDAYIVTLIRAAREWVESYLDRALITQQLVMTLEELDEEVYLPRPPMATAGTVTAVSITYTAPGGTVETLSPSVYRVSRYETPGEITPVYGATWPANRDDENAVTVTWWAGYGQNANDVPAGIKNAMLLCIHELYEKRGGGEMPAGAKMLLDAYRWGGYR